MSSAFSLSREKKTRPTLPNPVRTRAALFIGGSFLAERAGFEPAIPIARDNGFRDRRLQPLGHLSAGSGHDKSQDYSRNHPFFLRARKKARSSAADSSARSPPTIPGRWLRSANGKVMTDATAPA